MGSPSTLGVSTPGVSTSAPPASGPSPGGAGAFSQALADELQRRLDEEGWQAGNPAPGRPAGESPSPGGEKAEHPLLRAGPEDLGIRFVNRDGSSPDGKATNGQRHAFSPSLPTQIGLLGFVRTTDQPTNPPDTAPKPSPTTRPAPPEIGPSKPGTGPALRPPPIPAPPPPIPAPLAGAAVGVVAFFASTVPAGKERETGTTADGGHFTADERTIDVRRADGTQQRGFLNSDGKSWNTADGTPIAQRNAAGAIEIEPPTASGKKPDDETQKPSGTEKEKADPEPSPGPHRSSETQPADECRPVGPPTPKQIQTLIDEHSRSDGHHLTWQAAESIFKHTQPENTRVEVPGMNREGSDIIYWCGQKRLETVQVKAIAGFTAFNSDLRLELQKEFREEPGKDPNKDPNKDPPKGSRIAAFQVPADTQGIEKWMGRYWGNRIKDDPDNWRTAAMAAGHQSREVLIVDPAGNVLYRGAAFDPEKAPKP